MTATMTHSENGRKDRRTLSTEIERFNGMIDGLDKAIPEAVAYAISQTLPAAVADAVKTSVGPAVAEAIRATVIDLLTHPEVQAVINAAHAPAPPPVEHPVPAAEPAPAGRPSLWQRAKRAAASAAGVATRGLSVAIKVVASPVAEFTSAAATLCRKLDRVWGLRRPLLIAGGAGVVVGTVAYAAPSWAAGLLAGGGAAVSALLTQLAAWGRRLCGNLI